MNQDTAPTSPAPTYDSTSFHKNKVQESNEANSSLEKGLGANGEQNDNEAATLTRTRRFLRHLRKRRFIYYTLGLGLALAIVIILYVIKLSLLLKISRAYNSFLGLLFLSDSTSSCCAAYYVERSIG